MLGAGEKIKIKETVQGRRGKTSIVEKEYKLLPNRIKELSELEREALQCYKREYMVTFKSNINLLGVNGETTGILTNELREVSRWGVDDLPQKTAYAVNWLPITEALKLHLESLFGFPPESDEGAKMLCLFALDNGLVTPDEIKKLTDKYPVSGKIRYDNWWVTGTTEGMISYIHASVTQTHPEVTKEQIRDSWGHLKIVEASRIVDTLTTASVGNG
jgi:hypothetical protein